MDAVLVEALAQTPEGQAFTGLSRSATSEEVRTAWESFTQVLSTDYLPQLQTAAGDDATAGNAVTALTTYTSMSARLASGEVPEYQDETQAEQDIKTLPRRIRSTGRTSRP